MHKITIDPLQAHRLLTSRIIMAGVIVGLLVVVIFARLYYLQVYQHNRYTTLSDKNQISILPVSPKRGLIYDRDGLLLAENIPTFSLAIIPDKVSNIEDTIAQLREIIDISVEQLIVFKRLMQQRRRSDPIPIRFKLNEQEVAQFAVNQYRFPGVLVKAQLIRHYPSGASFSHVLGYLGYISAQELSQVNSVDYQATDFIGKVGIEKYYERLLHGKVGYEEAEKDASGRVVRVLKRASPVPGNDIYLTIDSSLQIAADKAMGDSRGAVVVMDPRNGEVLALVSKPNFDPNQFIQGFSHEAYQQLFTSKLRPLFNRAIRGQYPPASTIKPFIAVQALDANIINSDHKIYDPGWFELPNSSYRYRDWKRNGHGWINLHRAIVASCDTFFYQLANLMGIEHINNVLRNFGFGQVTGIDLVAEQAGLIPDPAWKKQYNGESWYPGDTIITGIGQGYTLATPLQLALATAHIANKGKRIQAHLLLKQILPDQTTLINTLEEKPAMTLSNPQVWGQIIDAMDEVTTDLEGTGIRFGHNSPYKVAAKTGTAQVVSTQQHTDKNKGILPEELRDHSLFIAFAPVHDPEIAIAVIVENEKHAPNVARQVMDHYMDRHM